MTTFEPPALLPATAPGKRPWLVMTKGLPASGKSTWALKQVRTESHRWARCNKDDLRAMLHGGEHKKSNEAMVLRIRDAIVIDALVNRRSVVVDDTNLHPKHEERLRELAEAHNAVFHIADFTQVNVEECIKRDAKRVASVGPAVIRRMHREYLATTVLPPPHDPALPDAVICDLDGTLADVSHRSPYDTARCDADGLIEPVWDLVSAYLASRPGTRLVLCTGRTADHRARTEAWLARHGIVFDELLMKAAGDTRPDTVVKRELYDNHIAGRYNVRMVWEDRSRVVEMWRSLGLPCHQVDFGDY